MIRVLTFAPVALLPLALAAVAAQQPTDTNLRRRVPIGPALSTRVIGNSAAAQQQRVTVPRLIGLDTTTAIRTLALRRTLRGVPHLVVLPNGLVPIDSIVDQRPLPDSAVTIRDTIRLILGGRAVVPQLIGRRAAEVVKILEAARLAGKAGTAPAAADSQIDRVVRQAVDSGTLVAPFTPIAYYLGTDARIAMPNVLGRTLAGARATLRDSGLTTDPGARNATGEGTPVDSVALQEPTAGTRVWPATPVVLTLGLRPLPAATTTHDAGATSAPVVPPKPHVRPKPSPAPAPTPAPFDWLPIAIAAVVVVLTGTALAVRAAWVPRLTSHVTLRDYPPRLASADPTLVAGHVSLRARVESQPSRVAVTGHPSLLA